MVRLELRSDGKSLRQIATALAAKGYADEHGKPHSAAALRSMLKAKHIVILGGE
jgi:hypothetical protein